MMAVRQALALALMPDLHAIARKLDAADSALMAVRRDLRTMLEQPPGTWPIELLILIDVMLDDVVETEALLIEARSDLTGRRPETLLRDRRPRAR